MLASCARRLRARGLSTATSASASAPVAANGAAVRVCVLAILSQHAELLHTLDDHAYTFASPLLQASVAQHTRHSLDHLRKPVEAVLLGEDSAMALVRYDVRQRNTDIEHDRGAALAAIQQLQDRMRALDDAAFERPLRAAFMLAADGHEVAFASTLSRELAFAVHHCIHHNALSKVLLRHHFPDAVVPPTFGMAPSTTNFLTTTAADTATSDANSAGGAAAAR
ncbi:hypothetical protein PybrP1_004093 [[Pythium] brassicae (nom. inval.)]|nr:hypothetical protein PybrP1_004093 [[Pythium] brassicae (nom. inval.)]